MLPLPPSRAIPSSRTLFRYPRQKLLLSAFIPLPEVPRQRNVENPDISCEQDDIQGSPLLDSPPPAPMARAFPERPSEFRDGEEPPGRESTGRTGS
jgi:hypothetical protein